MKQTNFDLKLCLQIESWKTSSLYVIVFEKRMKNRFCFSDTVHPINIKRFPTNSRKCLGRLIFLFRNIMHRWFLPGFNFLVSVKKIFSPIGRFVGEGLFLSLATLISPTRKHLEM